MLILTRRPGERVVIDENILIEVMAVSGHTVRLGISAPEGVSIYREEIWLAVEAENRAAAAADPSSLPTGPRGGGKARRKADSAPPADAVEAGGAKPAGRPRKASPSDP